MRNSEKWAALSVLVVGYACATGVTLEDGDYALLNGEVLPGGGGSETGAANGGASGSGQSGSGATPGSGGTAAPGNGGTGAAPGQGGTGAAQGGSGGALAQGGGAGQGGGNGTGGTGTVVEPTGDCAPAGGTLQIGYINTSQANQIGMMLRVVQNPGGTYLVNDLTIRYWFERDNFPLTSWVGQVDYQSQGNMLPLPGTTFTFADALGYSYAELSFTSTSPIGTGLEAVNVRLHANYVTLDLTDDPSFDPAAVAPTFVVNQDISAYVDGVLVFGCEPDPDQAP
jgi:hypothetical protein